MLIRPLFLQPHHLPRHADVRWHEQLRSEQPSNLRLTSDGLERLEYEAWAYAATLNLNRSYSDIEKVTEQLKKIKRQAINALQASNAAHWSAKLTRTLQPPNGPRIVTEKARLVALDYLALRFLTVERMRAGKPPTGKVGREEAYACFARQAWDGANLYRLCTYVDQTAIELYRDAEETRLAIAPAIGRLQIVGQPFAFKPDPLRVKGFRPDGQALADFARQLVLLYRWMGGSTGFSEAKPTPFMWFLDTMKEAVPKDYRPEGDRLHSRAREFLSDERSGSAA